MADEHRDGPTFHEEIGRRLAPRCPATDPDSGKRCERDSGHHGNHVAAIVVERSWGSATL